MYSGKGGYDNMIACHKLLRESYGSYAGWFISKEFTNFKDIVFLPAVSIKLLTTIDNIGKKRIKRNLDIIHRFL